MQIYWFIWQYYIFASLCPFVKNFSILRGSVNGWTFNNRSSTHGQKGSAYNFEYKKLAFGIQFKEEMFQPFSAMP